MKHLLLLLIDIEILNGYSVEIMFMDNVSCTMARAKNLIYIK